MAVMYVWTKDKDSYGHASLSFNDNSSGKSLPFSFESGSLPGKRRRRTTKSSRGGSQGWKSPFSGTNNIFEWEQMFSKVSWLWNPPVLKLPDPPMKSFYISWWPTEDKSKNSMKKKKSEGRTKKCLPVDYEDDRNDFTGREFTHQFYIRIGAKGFRKNTEMVE
ncbi:uncharacterized protein LOC134696391 [Mytilus trossulus]|uniref:uncharacterized protein LOC134696391 n=1 Tax=Mytilus trossulus TaxID=6551 RepID=UPI0030074B8A